MLPIIVTCGIRPANRSVEMKNCTWCTTTHPPRPRQKTGTGCNNKHREKAFQDTYPHPAAAPDVINTNPYAYVSHCSRTKKAYAKTQNFPETRKIRSRKIKNTVCIARFSVGLGARKGGWGNSLSPQAACQLLLPRFFDGVSALQGAGSVRRSVSSHLLTGMAVGRAESFPNNGKTMVGQGYGREDDDWSTW